MLARTNSTTTNEWVLLLYFLLSVSTFLSIRSSNSLRGSALSSSDKNGISFDPLVYRILNEEQEKVHYK